MKEKARKGGRYTENRKSFIRKRHKSERIKNRGDKKRGSAFKGNAKEILFE